MRYRFILLILSPLFSFSQAKNDSKIIVTVSDTSNLFNRVLLQLYENGYALENKDEVLKFAATKEKNLGKGATLLKVKVLVKDSTLTLTGLVGSYVQLIKTDSPVFIPVEYRGMKGSSIRIAWEEMLNISKQFGSGLGYSK